MSDVISELLYEVGELKRRMANIVHYGTIAKSLPHDTDDPNHHIYARVKIGDLLTAPLPWVTSRAGNDVTWWKPSIGEQVVVLSPCGDLAQGTILPSLYQNTYMPKDKDGGTPAEGTYVAKIGNQTLQVDDAGRTVTATEPVTLNLGNLTIDVTTLTITSGLMTLTLNDAGIDIKNGEIKTDQNVQAIEVKVGTPPLPLSTHIHATAGGTGTASGPEAPPAA